MKKIVKQVSVYDCGNEGCLHIKESEARKCIERTIKSYKKEIKELNMFIDYFGTRTPLGVLAERHGYKIISTFTKRCGQVLKNFITSYMTEENVKRYGNDLSLPYATTHHTEMWIRLATTRRSLLEGYCDD